MVTHGTVKFSKDVPYVKTEAGSGLHMNKFGAVKLLSDVQPANALASMDTTDEEMVKLVNAVQP